MINAAINHLAMQLNQYFRNNYHLVEDVVVVSNLVELDGNLAANANNKVVLMLANIEKDTVPGSNNVPGYAYQAGRGPDQRLLVRAAPLYLNLYIMMAANFGGANYAEALKYISSAIHFFQTQPVFDQVNSPGLDQRIEKLILDIENLKIQDLNNLWSLLGGKYLPSVFYRVRMLSLHSDAVLGQVPRVEQTDIRILPEG